MFKRAFCGAVALFVLAGCTAGGVAFMPEPQDLMYVPQQESPAETTLGEEVPLAYAPTDEELVDRHIVSAALHFGVPLDLVRSVVDRESGFNPGARNGPYFGLMQISYPTARSMGYRGDPEGLLDAQTNLKYGVKYLRGAWLVARGNRERADYFYRRGYYYEAKRMGLLYQTGLLTR